MKTWDEYKDYVKGLDPDSKKEMEEIEDLSALISAVIKQRNDLGMTQRELAELSGLPQSSVARIETMKITPKPDTFLKILHPLGLKLTISK
ncbi:MAG: helix-turn-helix domain-containing protein [Acetatifactor sp.]|nr:helix-turn-helix domain-containing protein [Acetatifactor sp.]